MKKTLAFLIGLSLTMSVFAGSSDSLEQLSLTISTQGPDLYADGTPVLVGETYLLVYLPKDQTFGGVLTDGSLADPAHNTLVTTAKAVEGSKCEYKPIQYPATLFPSDGTFVIVLLDTRKADGTVGGLVAGHSVAQTPTKASGMSLNALNGGGGAAVTAAILPTLPAGTPTPVITSIAQAGETVSLSIKEFSYGVNYEVQAVTNLGTSAWAPAKSGIASRLKATTSNVQGDELKTDVTVPQNDTVRFFRVIIPSK